MAYFKTEPYIRKAVESILAQTETRWRLVIVNDGGDPDEVWKPIEDIQDPRIIRFDLSENHGPFFAARVVLESCDTEFFLPHDSDDWSDPGRLEDLVKDSAGADFIVGPLVMHDTDGINKRMIYKLPTDFGPMIPWFSSWANLWRTDFLKRIGGIDPSATSAFDGILSGLAVWMNAARISNTNQAYHYVRNPTSITMGLMNDTAREGRQRVINLNARRWGQILGKNLKTHREISEVMTDGIEPSIIDEMSSYSSRLSRLIRSNESENWTHPGGRLVILYFSPRYPPFMAGGETAAHGLSASLASAGISVTVVSCTNGSDGCLDGVRVMYGRKPTEYGELIDQINPDVIMAQFEAISPVSILAKQRNIPVVAYIHGREQIQYCDDKVDLAICNTHTMATLDRPKSPSIVVHPIINFERVKGNGECAREYVTAVNQQIEKGGNVFWEVASRLPDIKFMAVKGAYGRQIERQLSNVTVIPNTPEIGDVYQQTKILLVLSTIEESFGMVGIEAQSHGIPIIAFDKPTLRESFGDGAIFLRRNGHVASVIDAVARLSSDKDLYADLSMKAMENAKRFENQDYEVKNLIQRLHVIRNLKRNKTLAFDSSSQLERLERLQRSKNGDEKQGEKEPAPKPSVFKISKIFGK